MIKKILRNKKGIISVKKENEEKFYSLLNDYLKKYPTSKIYEYFNEEIKFYNTRETLTNLNDLLDCLDDLYPQGIKNEEIILIIKETNLNLENQDILNYLNEFKETKEDNPNYKFTIFLLNSNISDVGENYVYNFYELDKSEFSFIDGKINGVYKFFYETREVKLEYKYTNGEKIEHIRYYKNGKIAFKYDIKNGRKHGNYEYYSKDGKKRLELSFWEGKKDGELSYFDSLERHIKIEDFDKGLYLGKLEVDYFSDNSKECLHKEFDANNFMYLQTCFIDDIQHRKEIFKAILNEKIVDIYIHTYKENRMEGYEEDLVYINNGKANTIFEEYINMENLNSLNISISEENLIKRVKYFQKNDKLHGISLQENYLTNDIEAVKLFENGNQVKDTKRKRKKIMNYYLEQNLLTNEEYNEFMKYPFINSKRSHKTLILFTILILFIILIGLYSFKNRIYNSTTTQESNINISNIEKNEHIEKFSSDNITTLHNEETYYYTDNQILIGTLDLKTVENIDGKLVKPYYIFLEKPIEVIPKPTDTDGFYVPENNILELQLILNENDINYLKQNEALGKKVRITGELFGHETAYHYSNVLMDVKKIEILDEVTNNQEKILKKLNSQNISYESYYSSKFDFNVDYPNTDFKIISSNNDAIYLEDIYEKGISITIFGEETDQIYNIEDIYNFYKEKHKNTLGYNLLKKDFMVITYSEKNNLVYQKTMNGPTDYSKISLVVKFPKEYKEYMSPIIDRIVKTMKLKNSTSPRLNLSIEKRNIFYGKLENGKEIKIFKEGDIYTYEYGSNGKVEISLSRKSGEGVFSDFGNFGGNAYVYNLRFINGEYSYIISKIITNKTDYELEVYKNNPNNLILEKAIKVVAGDIDEIHAEIEKDNESYLSW